jgi:hypothetical protein
MISAIGDLLLYARYCDEPVRHLSGLAEEVLVRSAVGLAEAVLSVVVQDFGVHLGSLAFEGGL